MSNLIPPSTGIPLQVPSATAAASTTSSTVLPPLPPRTMPAVETTIQPQSSATAAAAAVTPTPTPTASIPSLTKAAATPIVADEQQQMKKDYSVLFNNLSKYNSSIWIRLGKLADKVKNPEQALYCYENALRNDKNDAYALERCGTIHQANGNYALAVERFQNYLRLNNTDGNVWCLLGHCFLSLNELQKASMAYQQAIHLKGHKDPSLWYGLGILYERNRMYDAAEQSFINTLHADPTFDRISDVYLHLGKIYKAQNRMVSALECFKRVLEKLPQGVTMSEILILCAQIYESQGSFSVAIDLYENILREQPKSVPVLRTLGWLYQAYAEPRNPEKAVAALLRAVDINQDDALSWYLLGRSWMAQAKYRKAYDAYRQAVYRDSGNAAYWCSVGILYYLIGQYRDALDAYSRAVKLDRNMCEVWYNLGTLYETCSQTADSLDAFKKAEELNPTDRNIRLRLESVKALACVTMGMSPAATAAQQGKRDPVKEGEPPKLDDRGTPMTMEPPAPISIGGARKSAPPSPHSSQVQSKQVQQVQQQQVQLKQQNQSQTVSEQLVARNSASQGSAAVPVSLTPPASSSVTAASSGVATPVHSQLVSTAAAAAATLRAEHTKQSSVVDLEKGANYHIQDAFQVNNQTAASTAGTNFPPLAERQNQQQSPSGVNVSQSPVKVVAGEKRPSVDSASDVSSLPMKSYKL